MFFLNFWEFFFLLLTCVVKNVTFVVTFLYVCSWLFLHYFVVEFYICDTNFLTYMWKVFHLWEPFHLMVSQSIQTQSLHGTRAAGDVTCYSEINGTPMESSALSFLMTTIIVAEEMEKMEMRNWKSAGLCILGPEPSRLLSYNYIIITYNNSLL